MANRFVAQPDRPQRCVGVLVTRVPRSSHGPNARHRSVSGRCRLDRSRNLRSVSVVLHSYGVWRQRPSVVGGGMTTVDDMTLVLRDVFGCGVS